jgi:hypothetical protein
MIKIPLGLVVMVRVLIILEFQSFWRELAEWDDGITRWLSIT